MSKKPPEVQAFERIIVDKLDSRSNSLLETFLLLDADGDGYINRSDLKVTLHNKLGIDLTLSQMNAIFARFAYFENNQTESSSNDFHGIRYADFAKYIYDTANSSLSVPSSQIIGTGLDLVMQESGRIIVPPEGALSKEMRMALKQKMQQSTVSQKGMTETSLFLKMDDDRSGKVTPEQFREWARNVGMELSDMQSREILGKHYHDEGVSLNEFISMIEEMDDVDGIELPWEEEEEIKNKHLLDVAEEEAKKKLKDAVESCIDDSKMDKEIIKTIAENLFSTRTKLVEAFRKFNCDGSGNLTIDEFWCALKDFGLGVSRAKAASIFDKFDRNNDGKLSQGEFVMLVSSVNEMETESTTTDQNTKENSTDAIRHSLVRPLSGHEDEHDHQIIASRLDEEDIRMIIQFRTSLEQEMMRATEAFRKMDTNDSKYLSIDQLRAGFVSLNVQVSDEHMKHIMNRFDSDGTGKLKYHQFIKILSANLYD